MYKLVILIEPQSDKAEFDAAWPEFLHHAEQMPGLRQEATSRVDRLLHGHYHVEIIHELYFDSFSAAKAAMASPAGEEAGKTLQRITGGRVTLLFADHKEDDLENIKRHRKATKVQADGEET